MGNGGRIKSSTLRVVALGRAYIEIVGDVRRFAPDLRRGLTKALKIGVVGSVAASAASQLLGLVAALSSVGGAAFAIPSALAVGVAAVGALRVATAGLGEALKAAATGDAAAFAKAIEGLAPQAQRVAAEFRAVKPALDDIRVAAQDAFAAPIVGQIQETAAVLAGPLRSGLAGIAAEYGRAARQALVFARDSTTVSALSRVLTTARDAVANLTASLGPLLAGVRDLAVVALPTIGQLSLSAGGAATQFGEWLSAMAQSGAAVAAIQTAFGVLSQLGQIIGDIGGILSDVISAASPSGGLLSSLAALTGGMREFFASADGGAALAGIFEALTIVASGLSPLLVGVFRAIGDTLVPALIPLAQALAPSLKALVPALAPLGQVIAALAVAIAPLLPVIADLISMLIGPLAQALTALEPLLTPVLTALGSVLLQIGRSITAVLAPIAGLLADLFAELGPPLGEIVTAVGTALAPALDAVGPLIVQVVQALIPLIPTIVSLVPPLVEIVVALTPLIELVAQLATVAIAVVAPLLKATAVLLGLLAAKALAPLVSAIASALAWLLSPLSGVAAGLGRVAAWLDAIDWAGVGSAIGQAFATAWTAVVGFFEAIGMWFAALPGRIAAWLSGLPQLLRTLFTTAAEMALQALGVGIGLILYAVTVLPGQIIGALTTLPMMLGDLFTAAWLFGRQAFLAGVNAVVDVAVALPSRVSSGLFSLRGRIQATFSSAIAAGRAAAVKGFASIVSHIAGIPRRISSYAGRFLAAGSGLVKRLVDGLRRVPSLGSIASAITSTIRRQLNNIIGAINRGVGRVDALLPGSLPRIPYLADGAILRRPTLFVGGEAGNEVVIPLTRPRRARQLAEESGLMSLLGEAGGHPIVFNRGAISVTFEGVVPTRQEAWQTGQAVGDGVWNTLARRSVATTVRTI